MSYLSTAIAFSVGRPWRLPFYRNYFFTLAAIVILVWNLMLQMAPGDKLSEILEYLTEIVTPDGEVVSTMDKSWKDIILIIVAISIAATFVFGYFVFPYLAKLYYGRKKLRSKTG